MIALKEKSGLKKFFIMCLLLVGLLFISQVQVKAQALYSGVPVSDNGTTGNSISQANTSRCLAVAADGTIYAVYHGTNGIRVAKSTNRGASFSPSVLVRNGNFEAEVAVSSTSTVFVTWVENGTAQVSRSTDGGVSFLAPVNAGTAGTSVHMAVDGNYVYLIERGGNQFYYSSNSGQTFTKKIFNETYVFSDVHINPLTGEVIVQKDNPSIIYYISQDHGQTFGTKKSPAASVNYSVGGISAGPLGSYLFVAGYNTMATRINLADGSAKTLTFGSTATAQGRSLSVDGFGNVVTGFVNGGNVYYAVSQNLGDTFGATRTVAAANMANAAANTTNGDVMFLYESGGKIYLSVFGDELKGYSLEVSTTNLNFPNQGVGSESEEKTITVTNKGASDIAVKKIDITGSDFVVSHNLGSVIKAGQSYDITVKFAPTQAKACSGLISILTGISTEPRTIQLSGTGTDMAPPETTVQVSGTKGLNDTYIGDVTLIFTATDGQSNVARTEYSLNNGQSWIQSSGTADFPNDGSYNVLYRSIDNQNNVETAKQLSFKIDKTAPTANVEYSNTNPTNTAVSAKITPSEKVTITNNSGSDTYTFTQNGSFTFEFADEAGNVGTATATVNNIDTKPPTASILYDITDFTNKDVIVKLQPDESVIVTNNNGSSTYTFTSNGSFTFEFKDAAGNTGNATATVENIDKTEPVIQYEIQPAPGSNGWNNSDVIVHFTATDNLSGIEFITTDIPLTAQGANQTVEGKAVDKAGNIATITVTGLNIDKTAPDLSYELSPAPNSKGWNKEDVLIHFTATDELSGIDFVTPDTTVTTNGDSQEIVGKAIDKAGNEKVIKVIINLDKITPSISGKTTIAPNSNGWFNKDVTVHFTAEDIYSGIETVSQDVTLTTEGENQSVTGTAADRAENTANMVVESINIDKTAPKLTYEVSPLPNENGWNNGDVLVHFIASDDLSGIDSVTPDVILSLEGKDQSVEGTAVDKAGNATSVIVSKISIDKAKPTLKGETTTAPNSNGWYKDDVTVKFSAEDALSGVETVSPEVAISTEGANQSVTGTATDKAGNSETTEVKGISIDKTAPVVSGETTTKPNESNWFNQDVTVKFNAVDTLSGVETISTDVILTTDGANQSVQGTAADKAGNTGSTTVTGINIDKSAPNITIATPMASQYKTNESIKIDFTAVDGISGIKTTTATLDGKPVTNGQIIRLAAFTGTHLLSITSTDNAGNVSTKTVTFTVIAIIDGKIKVLSASGKTKADTDTLFPRFKVINNGKEPIKLSDVKLRYYYTTDINMPQNFFCDWSTVGDANVTGSFVKLEQFKADADYYLEIGFTNTAGILAPGAEVEIHSRIGKSDWSSMNQLNDFSFSNDKNYAITIKTPGYLGGQLQFGLEPEGETILAVEKVKVQAYNANVKASSATISPRINLVNTGNTDIKLSDLKIRYYYTKDSLKDQNFWCDSSNYGKANVTGNFVTITPVKTTADTYLEIGFTSDAGILPYGDALELNLRLEKKDNSVYTQTNDYSFNGVAKGYVDSNKITIIKNGTVIWGVEP